MAMTNFLFSMPAGATPSFDTPMVALRWVCWLWSACVCWVRGYWCHITSPIRALRWVGAACGLGVSVCAGCGLCPCVLAVVCVGWVQVPVACLAGISLAGTSHMMAGCGVCPCGLGAGTCHQPCGYLLNNRVQVPHHQPCGYKPGELLCTFCSGGSEPCAWRVRCLQMGAAIRDDSRPACAKPWRGGAGTQGQLEVRADAVVSAAVRADASGPVISAGCEC